MSEKPPFYQRFFAELKRRRVFRVMAFYGAASYAVLEAVDIMVPLFGLSETVTRWVALLLLFGFPIAVVLEWAFELTPDGLRRETEAAPGEISEILRAPISKRWPSGLFALAGMIALLSGAWYAGRKSASVPDPAPTLVTTPSIAVLPFLNMSSDPEQAFFSDGISEELLNLLSRIPELRVPSRTSSFSFKGQGLGIPEIGRRLNVAHVLEGSVRKVGSEVRITAHLVDVETDARVWSETWDRTLGDIFAVQNEIAAEVADRLELTLFGAPPKTSPTDPEAYALFLQGRQFGRQRTAGGSRQAVETLKRALAIEPGYAPPWSELARVYTGQVGSGLLPITEGNALARQAVNRALEIDPGYAPAIAHLGLIAMAQDGDLSAAARHYQRALELAPTDLDIIGDAATLLQGLGRMEEAVALKEYSVSRDPVNPRAHHNLGNAYRWSGRWDESIASYRVALGLSPGHIGARTGIGQALLGKGEPEAALEAILLESSRPWRLIGLGMAYHALGMEEESDAALSELMDNWGRDAAYNIAYVWAFKGEADLAFEWLDRARDYGDPGLAEVVVENCFEGIHDDPRWLPFLADLGRSKEELDRIEFRVTLPR